MLPSKLLCEAEEAAISADFSESWTGLIVSQDLIGWDRRPNQADSKKGNTALRQMGGQHSHIDICFTQSENICISLGGAAVFSVPVVNLGLCQNEKFDLVFRFLERKISTEFT